MSDISVLLESAAAGDAQAAAEILPLVYEELRRLAAARLLREEAGHTLGATALVHEAYLRLVGRADRPRWQGRAHFFGAAAEAMRRILVDHARRRGAQKRRGAGVRIDLDAELLADNQAQQDADENLLAVHELLARLEVASPHVAQLVKLRFFAGLSVPEAAETLGVSPRTADSWWAYGRAWLAEAMRDE